MLFMRYNYYLIQDIAYHVYSSRFGTFLCNDVFDKEKVIITDDAYSTCI